MGCLHFRRRGKINGRAEGRGEEVWSTAFWESHDFCTLEPSATVISCTSLGLLLPCHERGGVHEPHTNSSGIDILLTIDVEKRNNVFGGGFMLKCPCCC